MGSAALRLLEVLRGIDGGASDRPCIEEDMATYESGFIGALRTLSTEELFGA